MEYINDKSKYSFYQIDKSDILESINYTDEKITPDIDSNNDYCDIFLVENGKIIEEYWPVDGKKGLYRAVDDDKLEILYEKYCYKAQEIVQIYTNEKMYNFFLKDGYISKITYIYKEDYKYLIDNKDINEKIQNKYAMNHTYLLVNDGRLISGWDNKNLQEARDLYIKYNTASIAIPANVILDEIIEIIEEFSEGKDIDKEELLDRYIYLQNFQEFCASSIETLAPFVECPEKADIKSILEKVKKRSNNMEHLSDLYLSDELKEIPENKDDEIENDR